MKNLLFILCLTIFSISPVFSQGTIILQSGDVTTIHQNLDDAYEAANNDDTIIISGGKWTGLTKPILKSISIIGSGYDPRYSTSTGVTTYLGSIDIRTSNVSIEGLNITGNIDFHPGESPEYANIVISRVRCQSIRVMVNTVRITNALIKESIFNVINTSNMQTPQYLQSLVTNCFIHGNIHYQSGLIYKNNIMFSTTSYTQMGDTEFANNIFTHWNGRITTWQTRMSYINNIFAQDVNIDYAVVNTGNKFNVGNEAIFELIPEGDTFTFDYVHTYKLKANSPAKNAGDDGTDCGVWGGAYPWKEVAVPMLPYIKNATVSPATNAQGKLNIKFNVEAQTK